MKELDWNNKDYLLRESLVDRGDCEYVYSRIQLHDVSGMMYKNGISTIVMPDGVKIIRRALGTLCYAEMRAHINRLKHPLVTNQSRAGRQNNMGLKTCYPGMQCPIIDQGKLDMLSQHAKCKQPIPACNHPIRGQGS